MQRRTFIAASAGALAGAAATGTAALELRPPRGRQSFSQEGEDIILADFLEKIRGTRRGTYLDIGAADPVEANNTYLLYLDGHTGVLVEPNPAYVERLKRTRPRDTVLQAGIGSGAGTSAPYYLVRGRPQLNTFSGERAATLQKTFGRDVIEGVLQMPLLPIDDVMQQHFGTAPDIVSIDVEGLEMAILATLDFGRFRPGALCIETLAGKARMNPQVGEFLAARGYVARAGTFVNTIFVDGELLKE